MKKIFFFLFFYCAYAFSEDFCADLAKKTEGDQSYIEHSLSSFNVISKEKLYFNSAPNDKCRNNKLFLIYGDVVTGYTEYDGFLFCVFYKKNGESVEGWLNLSGLKNNGYKNGPSGEEQMVYAMVPDVIKKNKLTTLKDECINIQGNDEDERYYSFKVSKVQSKNCENEKDISISILIRKVTLDIYTNQGSVNDEYHEITSK